MRQKFTGYQKDEETGLDFAEARMYQSLNGRFTAIDPLLASGKSANPQTFNRYVYVMNSPLILSDPSGMQAGTYYRDMGDGRWALANYAKQGFTRYTGPARNGTAPDGTPLRITRNGWRPIDNVLAANASGARPRSSPSQGYVNTALINSLAEEGVRKATTAATAAAVAVAIGVGAGPLMAAGLPAGNAIGGSALFGGTTAGLIGAASQLPDSPGDSSGPDPTPTPEASPSPLYGPFYRAISSSEPGVVTESGLLYGHPRSDGGVTPVVQAYSQQPVGASYEFYTPVAPAHGWPPAGIVHWYQGDSGVIRIDSNTAAIPAIVTNGDCRCSPPPR